MFKIIFWPFRKLAAWLASGLPSGKEEKTALKKLNHCATHLRYKKSCPACKALI